jgi:hypothetical protein
LIHDGLDVAVAADAPPGVLQDGTRRALKPGIEQQQPLLEAPARLGGADDRVDLDALVGVEANVLKAAVGREVLVLLADRLAENLDLYGARALRQFLSRYMPADERVECVQDSDGYRRG